MTAGSEVGDPLMSISAGMEIELALPVKVFRAL
jgi:hypothetical protein